MESESDENDSSYEDGGPLNKMLQRCNEVRKTFCSTFACKKCPYNTNKKFLILRYMNQCHRENKQKVNCGRNNNNDSEDDVILKTIKTKRKIDGDGLHKKGTIRRMFACEDCPYLQKTTDNKHQILSTTIKESESCCVPTLRSQIEAQKTNHTNLKQQGERNSGNEETYTVNDKIESSSEGEKPLASHKTNKRLLLLQHSNNCHTDNNAKSNGEKEDDSNNNKNASTRETKIIKHGNKKNIHDDTGIITHMFGSKNNSYLQTTIDASSAIDVDGTNSISSRTTQDDTQNQKTNDANLEEQEQRNSEDKETQAIIIISDSSSEDERPSSKIENGGQDREDCSSVYACDTCRYNTNTRFLLLRHLNQCHTRDVMESNGDKDDDENNGDAHNSESTSNIKTKTNKDGNDRHDNRQTIPLMFYCDNCSYRTTKKRYLALHMRSHSNLRPYKCKMCKRAYKNRGWFYKHNTEIHKASIYTCKLCRLSFTSVPDLVYHERNRHMQQESHKCTKCDRRDTLHQYQNITFAAQEDYDLKRPLNLDDEPRGSLYRYNRHSSAKCLDLAEQKVRIYSCHLCPAKTTHKCTLRKHIKRMHYPKKDLICKVCGETFLNRYNYKIHKYDCKKRFKCQLCSFSVVRFIHLERHMTLHAENSFRCSVCKELFRSSARLRYHQNLRHYDTYVAKKKEYMCYICNRSFAYKRCFLRHKVTHKFH